MKAEQMVVVMAACLAAWRVEQMAWKKAEKKEPLRVELKVDRKAALMAAL